MTVSVPDLRGFIGASTTDDAQITPALAEATELVSHHCNGYTVPAVIIDLAVKKVGAELFNQRKAPNGISQFASPEGAPVRVARDPMVAGYPILSPYIGLAIG